MKKTGKQNIRWNTMKILAVGFLSVIFLGAVLLWLPVSNEKSISFLDALFTSALFFLSLSSQMLRIYA